MPDPLKTYRAKRDFKRTAEPKGTKAPAARGDRFVIQKHAARRLHYDLRLERDGVLLSWAVTRGPSLVPGEKRLAVHVEDHPLDYGDFEGRIPHGEYGAGMVIVWDRGTWRPLSDPGKGLAKGHLEFELDGEKLNGRWHLIRMRSKPREKKENWLLIKGEDDAAREENGVDILEERPESVKTGRTIEEAAAAAPETGPDGRAGKAARTEPARVDLDPSKVKKARRAALPAFVEPCLATLQPEVPSGTQWLHEIKFDGYRLQAHLVNGKVTLKTRHDLDWTDRFGDGVISALASLPAKKALIDGELVVESAAGASDFSALQADLAAGRHDRFIFRAFDLLYLDGWDLRGTPLSARKELLAGLLAQQAGPIRYSEHFEADGDVLLQHACRLGLEGIVSKRRDAAWHPGRGKDWVKAKCTGRQELVVGGYVPSTTGSKGVGSLLLGYYENDSLHYAGRVGTGFSAETAIDLRRRLDALKRSGSPFDEPLAAAEAKGVRFAAPELVVEVEFRGWTAGGSVRQASFRGLREDKEPSEVVRERETVPERPAPTPNIELTHPDRLYWPDAGVAKVGLADYYAAIWDWIEPFVVRRPLSLVRCPEGVEKACFFQKHAWRGMSRSIHLVTDPQDKGGEKLLAIQDVDGMVALVQAAALEVHLWGATSAAPDKPDWITFDLDPGEGVEWTAVVEAAREVRERLKQIGLESFVKTTGGKGLHVVAPLRPKATWDAVKDFSRSIAEAMAKEAPDRFVAVATKSRRPGKIYVDYLRNARGATAIAPYSSRAKPGAPVSMPLDWEELGPDIGPDYFTVVTTPTRLAALKTDPWAEFFEAAGELPTGGRRAAKSKPGSVGKARRPAKRTKKTG